MTKAQQHQIRIKQLRQLAKQYHDAECALEYREPWQLLIATILSAQCTDERVNQVTRRLFVELPSIETLAIAPIEKVEMLVKPTGFFKNKAKNIKACAAELLANHQGQLPRDIESLVALPGVGRKTANVVLGEIYGIGEGIVVDTHVKRLSQRLGWTNKPDPIRIEKDLMNWVPTRSWTRISHWLIQHGRRICRARTPLCSQCFLENSCRFRQRSLSLRGKRNLKTNSKAQTL